MGNKQKLVSGWGRINIALCRCTNGKTAWICLLTALVLNCLRTSLFKVFSIDLMTWVLLLLPFAVNILNTCLKYFGTVTFCEDGYEIKTALKALSVSHSESVKIQRVDHVSAGSTLYCEFRINAGKKSIVLFTDKPDYFQKILETASAE